MIETNGKDLVIDANSLYARSYYAAQASPALKYLDEGFLITAFKSLFAAMRVELGVPSRILFCFDGKAKTIKPRKEKPKDFETKLQMFKQFVSDAFGPEAYGYHSEYEADDLVATVATRSAFQGINCIVMSGDKDLQQLKSDRIGYYCLNRKRLLSNKDICEKWAVHKPIQMAITLALRGDPGDGIKGVPKVGMKTVQKIFDDISPHLNLSETVDAVLKHLKPAQHDAFFESLDYTFLNTEIDFKGEPAPFAPRIDDIDLEGPAREDFARGVMLLDPDAAAQEVDEWDP